MGTEMLLQRIYAGQKDPHNIR